MEDIITEYCNIVSWYINIFKKEIDMSKDKNIKLDMKDISKLVCLDTIIEKKHSEEIYLKLKDILLNKGIYTTIDEYDNGEKFLILRKGEIEKIGKMPVGRPRSAISSEDEKKSFLDILKDNKLFSEEAKYLLCPECKRYSVKYITSNYDKNDKKWWCDYCLDPIIYYDYHLDISGEDKYHIYKLWGAEALSIFTNKSMKKTKEFVASYFKNCCVSKKDRCIYFDFFKEKEKEGKIFETEGDVVNEQ